jgi:hypothetical protein
MIRFRAVSTAVLVASPNECVQATAYSARSDPRLPAAPDARH